MNEQMTAAPENGGSNTTKIIIGVVVLVLIAVGVYYFVDKSKAPVDQNNPEQVAAANDQVIMSVSKTVSFTEDDKPNVLTITADAIAQLKQTQPFFASIEVGQHVLIFPKTQRVLVWDPISEKIVNFGSIIYPNQNQTQAPVDTTKTAPKKK